MGVVRKEGAWRLEKADEGVYEITLQKQVKEKVVTSDYTPSGFMDERNDFSVPVHEVESFSEVESLFEEVAGRNQTGGFGGLSQPISRSANSNNVGTTSEADLSDLPPAGFLVIGFVVGPFLLYRTGFDSQSPVFLLGLGLVALGLFVSAFTYRAYATEGPGAAVEFLLSTENEDGAARSPEEDDVEKTPPAPEKLKNELYFGRADKQCEWCGERIDSPDVHHIKPRSEGGPNDPENLIVLCPNCHRKADREVISRSKLRYQISQTE